MGISNKFLVKSGKKKSQKSVKGFKKVHAKKGQKPQKGFKKVHAKKSQKPQKGFKKVHESLKSKNKPNFESQHDEKPENEQFSEVDSSGDEIEDYEKTPRLQKTVNVRNLLPVKHKDGLVFRSMVVKDDVDDDAETEPSLLLTELKKERKLTLVERYAIQKKVLDDLKCKVALLCTSIVEDPENNISTMKELITMLHDTRTQMVVSEKKILCFSLLHVFSDILPSYKIRLQEDKDPKQKLKKETKKLLSFETTLLRLYKKYIDYLCQLVEEMRTKKNRTTLSVARRKAIGEVGLIAVKCLSELLATRFSFNYFKNIANLIVPLINAGNDKVSTVCCQSFERMFRADKKGEASFDLVRQIQTYVRRKKFCVPACLLRSFLSLNLREAKPVEHKIDMKKGRKQWQNMSRTARKDKKKMKGLEAELKEAQAYESVEIVQKFHIKTLNKIFWVFFHILKDGRKRYLFAPALEGLSKFAWLINLEFFNDLNDVLCGLMESGKLSDVDKLHSVYTLFTILAGQAESLHIDPHKIYCHMYQGLLKLSHYIEVEHFILSLKCLEFNILRKKKMISFGRILAFTKRVATVSLQTPIHGTLALFTTLKNILLNVKGTDILLDTESTVGSGIYFPEMEDPEHCNAQSTALWELCLLKKHYNPFIKLYSQYLLHKCPMQGKLSLPETLAKSSPEDTLHLFADVGVYNKMDFLEESEQPPPKKFKFSETDDEFVYENGLDFDNSWKKLKSVDFFSF